MCLCISTQQVLADGKVDIPLASVPVTLTAVTSAPATTEVLIMHPVTDEVIAVPTIGDVNATKTSE